ncbi:MAG: Ig-like domain-containing protein [Ardenticatenaceae bacterium]|nr:Ig-like domain-containing protein [Ardenticatenaceae bacterium]
MSTKTGFAFFAAVLAAFLLIACGGRGNTETTPTTEAPTLAITLTPSPTPQPEPTFDSSLLDNPPDWEPQLVAVSPQPGQESLLSGSITLRFDQPMDPDAVATAFDIEPAVDGQFSWPRPDTLVFTPEGSLERNQRYQINISDEATGINGLPLREPIDVEIETVGFLQVSSLTPADGTADVEADAAVTVLFNRPVVPLVATADQDELLEPIIIDPPIEGTGSWISTSIYRFVPDNGWDGGTTYQVSVPSGLEDITGGVLEQSAVTRFTTQRPQLVSTFPFPNEQISPTQGFTVTFNMPMDQPSTESAIQLNPSTPLEFEWDEDSRTVGIFPQAPLTIATAYQLIISGEARSANGQAALEQGQTIPYETYPLPAVLYTEPPNGSTDRQAYGYVNIQFASPMDFSTIDGQIIVDPAPEEIEYEYFENNPWLTLVFPQVPRQKYTITIPNSAADPYGNTLGEDYIFSFTTAPAEPQANFALPYRINHLSGSFASEVAFSSRNSSQLDISLYDVDIPGELAYGYYGGLLGSGAIRERQSWRLTPAGSPDEFVITRLSLNDDGALPNGVYLLTLNTPEFRERGWGESETLLVVADTNLVIKQMPDQISVWATELATGEAAAGRQIVLYDGEGQELGSAAADSRGVAVFDIAPRFGYYENLLAVSGTPNEPGFGMTGNDWYQSVTPWELGLDSVLNEEQPLTGHIFTDRPLYRPGDTVYYRGVIRSNGYGRYSLPRPDSLQIILQEESYFNEPYFEEVMAELDDNGSFSGEFTLPEDANLGFYAVQLYAPNGDYLTAANFSMLEFRKPEVEVTVTAADDELLRGQPTEVTVDATYFFGGPAADLRVNYTATEQKFFFSPGLPYSFDEEFFWWDWGFFGPEPPSFSYGNLLEGEGQTDAQGRLVIELPSNLLEEIETGSRLVTVEATVTDVTNQTVSGRSEIIFHGVENYVGTQVERYVVNAGDEIAVNAIAVDWEANPTAGFETQIDLFQRNWERNDDGFYEPVDTLVDSQTATTDEDGELSVIFVPEEGGTYRVAGFQAGVDEPVQRGVVTFWVAGEDGSWRPEPDSKRMTLVADQQSYQVGETATILVQSPFEEPTSAWVSIERGTLLEQRFITLSGPGDTIALPITIDHVPNVHVTVIAVKAEDANIQNPSPYADIRIGALNLPVDRAPFLLNLELTPRLPENGVLEPGETAVFDIQLTDANGNPAAAELSLALVDRSLLSLVPDTTPNIADVFYSEQPYRSQIGASLVFAADGVIVELEEAEQDLAQRSSIETEEEAMAEFEVAADEAADGALAAPASAVLATPTPLGTPTSDVPEVREEFKDTAYWEAIITTDGSGRATVEIPLPDNLTTWQLNVRAITTDTKVGQENTSVTVNKPLLLRPITPRFFTAGDAIQLGTVINNNTVQAQEVTVQLEAEGLNLLSEAEQVVTVPANDQVVVSWSAEVPDVPFVDLTFIAESDEYQDATKPTLTTGPNNTIPVYRYNAEDIVATAGVLTDEKPRQVEAVILPQWVDQDLGSLEIELNASLAAAVLEGLEALDHEIYDRSCPHGLAHRLLPNAVTARTLNTLPIADADLERALSSLITADVADLEALQKGDGGWGWCYTPESSPYFTAYVLLALDKAQEAGFSVSRDAVDRAATYLQAQIDPPQRLENNRYEANQQVFYHYVLAEVDRGDSGALKEIFEENRPLLDPYAKALLAMAMTLSGGNQDAIEPLLSDLNSAAKVSATGAHWESQGYGFLSGDIRDTAIVLMTMARIDPDLPFTQQTVNWLMSAREAQLWRTAHNSSWVLLALTDWLAATGELDADYTYLVSLAGTSSDGAFDSSNIAATDLIVTEMSELDPAAINFVEFRKDGSGRLYYNAFLDTFVPAETVEAIDRGISVSRVYYDAACNPLEETCEPISEIEAGQQVRVELTVVASRNLVYAVIEDYFPAGAEAIDPNLQTSQVGLGGDIAAFYEDQPYRFGYWGWWYFNNIQYRDDRITFTSNFLPAGTYQYTYSLQAVIPGEYQVRPTFAKEEFTPEVNGRANGKRFIIVNGQ